MADEYDDDDVCHHVVDFSLEVWECTMRTNARVLGLYQSTDFGNIHCYGQNGLAAVVSGLCKYRHILHCICLTICHIMSF